MPESSTGSPTQDDRDLFECWEDLPSPVKSLVSDLGAELESGERCGYQICGDYLKAMEQIGYTFDYGLDSVPYDLRTMA